MMSYFVHDSSFIDEGAVIGEGTKVWHFCHISSRAVIGSDCKIGQNVYVANQVKIGNGVKIQNNVSLYEGVVLEDDVFCGPSMVFTNVRTPRASITRNTSEHYAKTIVRKGASIGANATVVCGVTIGEWAFIAAGAVVNRDIPAYGLYAGVPARRIGWVCQCGATLRDMEAPIVCEQCQQKYQWNNDVLLAESEVML